VNRPFFGCLTHTFDPNQLGKRAETYLLVSGTDGWSNPDLPGPDRPAVGADRMTSSSSLLTIPCAGRASAAGSVAGMSVFLDPGHNGANDSSISRKVPDGRGGTKDCETTGTATNDGFPEHTFNWDVVLLIRDALNQLGVRTELSRDNDTTLAPCIDQRAVMANAMRPDAIVSIHADGGPPSGLGFHVNYSSPPLNDAQVGRPLTANTPVSDGRETVAASGCKPLG
jgi:N-acetylmuramoyl-L-alanine amidase